MNTWNVIGSSSYWPGRAGSHLTNARRSQAGFSIVEVMMSLVLLALGMALALPSYRDMVEKRQVTHGAEQVMAFINSAQIEAAKQNSVLTVAYSRTDDDDWCIGAQLGAAACDCAQTNVAAADYCAIDGLPWVINATGVGEHIKLKAMNGDDGGDNAYSFDPIRGLLVNLDDEFEVELRSPAEDYRLNVTVSRTGQTEVCSDSSSHAVPGYPVCS